MKTPRTYASGFVDALALVAVTMLLIGAALAAGGCATSSHVVIDVRVVQCEPGPVPSERVCR